MAPPRATLFNKTSSLSNVFFRHNDVYRNKIFLCPLERLFQSMWAHNNLLNQI